MIRLLVLDVDGVLTDGTVLLDEHGGQAKRIHFRDVDAVHAARRAGIETVLVTGEEGPLVGIIAGRLGVTTVLAGRKDKREALAEVAAAAGLELAETCYVGDGVRDAPAIAAAGLGLAPADGSPAARAAAGTVLAAAGGHGAVEEAVALLLQLRG